MNIAIREPWGLLNRLSRDFDGFLGTPTSTDVSYIPAVDIREEKDRFLVQADLPGVKPEDIEVTAEKGILTLRGERKLEKRENARRLRARGARGRQLHPSLRAAGERAGGCDQGEVHAWRAGGFDPEAAGGACEAGGGGNRALRRRFRSD